MKNRNISYLLILFLGILIIVNSFLFFYKKRNNIQSVLSSTEKQQFISPRDRAIEEYLLSQDQFSWHTEKNSQNLCVFENLGNEEDLFPLSLWVYCQEYRIENGEIIELSGFSGPVLVDYPNIFSFFSINKFSHQSPRDGSLYAEDVKNIFPNDIQNKIFNFRGQKRLHEIFKQNAVDMKSTI